MNKWILRLGALSVVVAMALGIAASASAQGPGGQEEWWRERGDRLGQRLLDAVAEATGLPAEDILAQLREGQSLADIAEANGVEPQVIIDAVKAELSAEIEAAVDQGQIRARRGDRLVARLDAVLERAMNVSLPVAERPWAVRALREVVEVLGDDADLLPRTILREALSGSTLAEIAAAHEVEVDTLIADVKAHVAEHLQTAVDNGRLTAEERDRLMGELSDALPDLVNEPLLGLLGMARERVGDRLDATLLGTVSDLAGVDLDELFSEHFTFPSLEEVAESYGLNPETVLSETEARATEAINQAVAEGVITQAQADVLLDGLSDRLERWFETSFGPLRQGIAVRWGARWGDHGRVWR